MSLSTLPLSYCTNVHPGQTVDEVVAGLREHTFAVQKKLDFKIAAGLWLASPVIEEIERTPDKLRVLQETLIEGGLACYTLNTFPFGNFHSERVKDNVYIPDWASPGRLNYTLSSARVLAALMPVGVEGSLSTVPLGFKGHQKSPDFIDRCIDQLLRAASVLDELHDETGAIIRIAIEPEPLCLLETTSETIEFFNQLFAVAESRSELEVAQRHLGVCYDVCHQAVEFEAIPESIQGLTNAGIRINKVHLTTAIHVDRPGDNELARQQLMKFVEPRYLHQTFARRRDGGTVSVVDLTSELCESPGEEFRTAGAWRVHFHVPVHAEHLGELGTTRDELKRGAAAVAALDYAPHLEVETYTWGILPGQKPATLAEGITEELSATAALIAVEREAASV